MLFAANGSLFIAFVQTMWTCKFRHQVSESAKFRFLNFQIFSTSWLSARTTRDTALLCHRWLWSCWRSFGHHLVVLGNSIENLEIQLASAFSQTQRALAGLSICKHYSSRPESGRTSKGRPLERHLAGCSFRSKPFIGVHWRPKTFDSVQRNSMKLNGV